METKHTKGEWIIETQSLSQFAITNRNSAICFIPKLSQNADANSKLIAAAPELLEALVGLINSINPEDACRGKYKDFQPENPEIAKKAYVGAKSTPADEQILKALEAIEKATK